MKYGERERRGKREITHECAFKASAEVNSKVKIGKRRVSEKRRKKIGLNRTIMKELRKKEKKEKKQRVQSIKEEREEKKHEEQDSFFTLCCSSKYTYGDEIFFIFVLLLRLHVLFLHSLLCSGYSYWVL